MIDAKQVSVTELEHVYDEILVRSFPSAELESRADLVEALADATSPTGGLLALNSAGLVIGTIIGDWYAESHVMLISYLAVRSECRGGGVGRRLLAEAFASWRAGFAPALILGEVENPRHSRPHDPVGFGEADARLRLYGSLGARILAIPYFQPAISRFQPRVNNMLLMVFHADASAMIDADTVDGAIVGCFIDENIVRSEGQADDDEANDLREVIRGQRGIRLLPPEDYLHSQG